MKRTFVLAITAAAAAALTLPAGAAPLAPEGETYTAGPAVPDPTPIAGTTCVPTIPQSRHSKIVDIKGPGTLELKMVSTTALDWSVAILDSKGRMLGCTDGGTPETIETVKVKIKTAGKYTLASNNFAGTPTCQMKWTYTPAKK